MLPPVQAGSRDLQRAAEALASRLPEPLGVFARLAYNYRWSWDKDGPDVFRDIDPDRWQRVQENPVKLLQEANAERLPHRRAARRRRERRNAARPRPGARAARPGRPEPPAP